MRVGSVAALKWGMCEFCVMIDDLSSEGPTSHWAIPHATPQLTVITISDHHTRVSTGGGAQAAGGRVIGLLFGSQNGLDVSIYDAMEVACTDAGEDGLELNEAMVEKQKDLCEYNSDEGTADTPALSH